MEQPQQSKPRTGQASETSMALSKQGTGAPRSSRSRKGNIKSQGSKYRESGAATDAEYLKQGPSSVTN
jgi:hypothetical protein